MLNLNVPCSKQVARNAIIQPKKGKSRQTYEVQLLAALFAKGELKSQRRDRGTHPGTSDSGTENEMP